MHSSIRRLLSPGLVAVWILGATFGLSRLWRYEAAAGISATPPISWPAESRIRRRSDLPSLVLFLHPRCPCSRATLDELAKLLAQCRDRMTVTILMLHPAGAPDDWEKTDLWRTASALPGVTMRADEDGRESRRFGAATSGQVLLYSAQGRLLFAGGITQSRGHSGDNTGRAAIVSLVLEGAHPSTSQPNGTPVYGCPLFNTSSRPASQGTAQCQK